MSGVALLIRKTVTGEWALMKLLQCDWMMVKSYGPERIPPANGMESHPGLEGPVTISHDVLFSGSWDGMLRALSIADGKTLWAFNTARDFETVNGISANGGSMGAVGQVVEDGILLVTSGYIGVKNGATGNVLLVFTTE